MPIWLVIVLGVIQAIPSMIKIIQEIMGLIKKLPTKTEQKIAMGDLKLAIQSAKLMREPRPLQELIHRLRERLGKV